MAQGRDVTYASDLYRHPKDGSTGYPNTTESKTKSSEQSRSNGYPNEGGDSDVGLVEDPYGPMNKLGMVRTCLIFFTNQVGIGILSLPSVMHTIGLIPGIICIVAFGILATYTAYILIQFYRRYPQIRDVVDVARVRLGMLL